MQRAIKFYVFRDDIAARTAHRTTGPISATNFKDEIVNISGFNHENILKVIEAGLWRSPSNAYEIPFLVTEYIEGPTLQEAMTDGRLGDILDRQPYLLIDLILQICRGVAHLHAREFYHCDIAPKNIFLHGQPTEMQLVIGDLGIGRTVTELTNEPAAMTMFLAGSRDYCPEEVKKRLDKEISLAEFQTLQPHWDLFAVAKTAIELVDLLASREGAHPAWLDALRTSLQDVLEGVRFKTVDELSKRIRWLHPTQHTTWEVQELSENATGTRRLLLPIESVATSPRIRALLDHPSLLRLKHVPQLMLTSKLFAGGTHNRYEHSLGIYQNVRRYLLALLNDDEFLALFSPHYVELALVSALLSNITRFPFSILIHELHGNDKSLFREFSRENVFLELRSFGTPSLDQTVERYFPHIAPSKLMEILTSRPQPHQDPCIRLIKFLLSSSIDARVIDYLRRDSHHLGTSRGDVFDIDDLLQHIRFRDGQLVVRSTGLTAVEQIITLRYWLHMRIYWNRPNRTMFAMLKLVILTLHEQTPDFSTRLRKEILSATEESLLAFFNTEAHQLKLHGITEICSFLLMDRPKLYNEIMQFNRAEGDANARVLCDRFAALHLMDAMQLQKQLNAHLITTFRLNPNRVHVLLDLPIEYGNMKSGEDLNILSYRGEVRALTKLSGIVEGVQKSFTDHLQRLRVFMHPATYTQLQGQLNSVTEEIRDVLISLG